MSWSRSASTSHALARFCAEMTVREVIPVSDDSINRAHPGSSSTDKIVPL